MIRLLLLIFRYSIHWNCESYGKAHTIPPKNQPIPACPIIEALSSEYNGRAVIGKLNVDESPDISVNYGVRGILEITLTTNPVRR